MKNCTPLWREAHLKVKMRKPRGMLGPLLEVEMRCQKSARRWREAHFHFKMLKASHARTTFEGSDVVLRCRRKGFCTLPNASNTCGFCSSF